MLFAPSTAAAARRHVARGLTLIELMVSLTLGLVIIAAATSLFVSSSVQRTQIEASADVIEGGRYAIDVLARELSQAGYYGTLAIPTGTTIDVCSSDTDVWAGSLAIYAYGLNNNAPDPACLSRKGGTDAIFIQRASTCTTADTAPGCAEDATFGYLQVSECGTEYNATPFVVSKGNDPSFTLQTKTCAGTAAPKRKLIRRFFYVDSNDTLKSVDVKADGSMAMAQSIVENIEQLQIEYAIDSTGGGSPDTFTATPTAAQWPTVLGVRVWVLARSATQSRTAANASVFTMSDTSYSVSAATSNYKRRVYTTYIPFVTPKSREES